MLDQSNLRKINEAKQQTGPAYLCLHGHFYQPPRDDPFTGQIPIEPAATPFANFNEKITSECYRPNAEAGNFDVINFDLGRPWLPGWRMRIPTYMLVSSRPTANTWSATGSAM